MDDRIEQLREQATEDIMGVPVLDHRQFAELIVLECAALCGETASGRDAEDIAEAILKHFGVKE